MQEFQDIIRRLILLFRELTGIESKMLEAARAQRMAELESLMIKEQASVMQLRGLEKEKDRIQELNGYGGMRFQQMLETMDETEKEQMLPLFDEMSRAVQMFQEIHENLTVLMQVNLRQIDKVINDPEGQIYSGQRNGSDGLKHMTNQRG
jgi:Mg2+ and Co2+ transporter CorA